MTQEIARRLIDGDWVTSAQAEAAGGGVAPVSCVLLASGILVKTEDEHPILWSTLADNPWDLNPIGAIPAALGLVFTFDGTSSEIVTTDDGTWSFTHNVLVPADATFEGEMRDSMASQSTIVRRGSGQGFNGHMAAVYSLPAAAGMDIRIETTTAATGDPTATASLVIVRLG